MNILFGIPSFGEWQINLQKIPYRTYFKNFFKIDEFMNYIEDNKIDIIIPLTYQQMTFVMKYYNKIICRVKKIVCGKDTNVVRLLDNKNEFYKQFSQYVPQVYIIKTYDKKEIIQKPEYPCIYKLARIYGGIESFVINNKEELDNIKSNKAYIIQKYIQLPNEYSGNFYVVDGIIKFFVYYMMTNHTPHYIQHGRLSKYERVTEPYWLDTFTEIFTKLKYTGFACIDFKVVDNKPIIFEINPRLGGSIVCTNEQDLKKIIDVAINLS